METNRKIVILRGAPGSGKTTYAKKLVKEHGFKRINRDDLRDMFNSYKFDSKDEKFLTRLTDMTLIMAMNEGYNIVIDNTHAKQKYINDVMKTIDLFNGEGDVKKYPIPDYKYEVIIYTMNTSLEECISRNANRDRVVPEDVIRTMYKNING